ncbi:hypothetical protein HDU76_013180 [Blyttiomyces sp. JEL0837]|nr:hypothetical protein HDU76_013180 [Blyttiomyces sp. JEL0837]
MNIHSEIITLRGSESRRAWFNAAILASPALKPFLDHFSGSVMINWFYRALGARIGRNVFIHVSPESLSTLNLLSVGDNVIALGGRTSIFCESRDDNVIRRAPVIIGENAVIGHGSVLLPGAVVPSHAVLGPYTKLDGHENMKVASTWMGSPATLVQDARPEEITEALRKSGGRAAEHWPWLLLECLGQLLVPLLAFALPIPCIFVIGLIVSSNLGPWALIYFSPIGYGLFVLTTFIVVFLGKWFLVGRLRRETSYKLFGARFLGWTLFAALHRYSFSLVLDRLLGTDMMAGYWWLMGAKIGNNVYINSTDVLEYDLLQIDDEVSIGEGAYLAALSMNSSRVSLSYVIINERASIGSSSAVMPGSVVERQNILGSSSTAMVGETLTAEHYWEGSPAEGLLLNSLRPSSLTSLTITDAGIEMTRRRSIFGSRARTISFNRLSTGASSVGQARSSVDSGGRNSTSVITSPVSAVSFDIPTSPRRRAGPQNIFLSGATGFVGVFLLEQLLQEGHQVYCLVRSNTKELAMARIKACMQLYSLWKAPYEYSIIPVLGDLSKPKLGLEQETWSHLARIADIVIHCGAQIDYLKTFDEIAPVNVNGTKEMLEFAVNEKPKPFHYMSTLSVFNPVSDLKIDETNIPSGKSLHTGYTQSKFAAENLVMDAAKKGAVCYIYRLGRITGHSRTGAIPAQDFPFLLLKGIIDLGCYPVDLNAPVDVVPVDFATSLIAHFIRRSRSHPMLPGGQRTGARHGKARVYHLTHPRHGQLPDMCLWLAEKGYKLEGVSYTRWRDLLLERGSNSSLAPFIANFEPGLASAKWARFKCDRTIRDAEMGGFVGSIMDIDAHLIGSYVDFLVSSGALPPPSYGNGSEVSGKLILLIQV